MILRSFRAGEHSVKGERKMKARLLVLGLVLLTLALAVIAAWNL